MPLVTRAGFQALEPVDFVTPDALDDNGKDTGGVALDLPNTADPAAIVPAFNRITMIRIPFPNFADGRGFTLARRLRDLGYRGRLRAEGAMISDQFRYALACGFDEVEISDTMAARQPETHWRVEDQPLATYRSKLRGRPSGPEQSIGCV